MVEVKPNHLIKVKRNQVFAFTMLSLAAALTVLILLAIVIYVMSQGLSVISMEFLLDSPKSMGAEGGIYPAIVGTIYLVGLVILIAAPIGVGTAIYLNEYMPDGRFKSVLRFATELLAAIPSIVHGMFGFLFFVIALGDYTGGWSILSGALTGVVMILPIIIRASEEALRSVSNNLKEGSLALGTTRWYTIKKIVLPLAIPGITTSIILAIGRVIGETAAFLLTLGGSLLLATTVFDGARTLALHLYLVAMETGNTEMAFGTGAVLIVLILIINLAATGLFKLLVRRFSA
ncbi:phosphate transport system permease protein [Gracilibacillus halotolerans]|uniref:Phosphate transport system permease protein PstA n=1 Tax=Gracilibacillus halotolerans TaxID=74386 RepID=A0A841RN32_9BACI|nr:phosphate ABC transporter permease PstA [Gracilibacillus halotolerans]MBB6513292.1 phosphate transport system permease protein [Gracilibacillus halotolerans]